MYVHICKSKGTPAPSFVPYATNAPLYGPLI